jgi:hypothetical protein
MGLPLSLRRGGKETINRSHPPMPAFQFSQSHANLHSGYTKCTLIGRAAWRKRLANTALPDPLRQYLEEVESAVRDLQGVFGERYQEEILTAERVNLRIRIRFPQGFLLELNESVISRLRVQIPSPAPYILSDIRM